LRRGGESAVTGSDGSFHLSGETSGPVSLDPLSLPMGWIQEPFNSSGRSPELGVVAVAAVEVSLQLASDALGRVSMGQLAGAVVLAHDEHDRVWIARPMRPGLAVFFALPPGRYRLELDLSEVTEPLTPVGALP